MKKIFPKILAFSFALVIPLTAFLITTNQKNVSASDYGRLELYEPFGDDYFTEGYNNGYLAGTNTYIQYNYGLYQKTPLLHIPFTTTEYITRGNSFYYDYTLDSTTIYKITLSQYVDYMVMYSDSTTNLFTIEFDNLVLFTETAYGDTFNKTQFYNSIDEYFSYFVKPVFGGDTDISFRMDANFATDTSNIFEYYYYTNTIETNTHDFWQNYTSVFNGLFDVEGELKPLYSNALFRGDFMNFVMPDNVVLDYFNGYFIIPKLVFTFDFSNDINFYIRSRLASATDLIKTKIHYSMYQHDFLMNILSYNGFSDYYNGFGLGYNEGYNKGYSDGAGDLTPFDFILHTVESFLNFKIFPQFPVYYFFLIAFGFALFGVLVKYALGG